MRLRSRIRKGGLVAAATSAPGAAAARVGEDQQEPPTQPGTGHERRKLVLGPAGWLCSAPRSRSDRFLRILQENRILQRAGKWPLAGSALVSVWANRYPTLKGGFQWRERGARLSSRSSRRGSIWDFRDRAS